jgi:P-type Mg2+ transporter
MPQHHAPSPVTPGGLDAHVAMMPLAQLCARLHASERGLTQAEAQERLLASGLNEPVAHRQGHGLRHMLTFAANPLVVILLLASLVSGLLHDVANATIIALMVLLSMVLNVVQTYRSQQAAERLRDEVAPTAAVLRDATWIDLPRRDLVPGDVIRLAAGDRVPADARLLTSRDLHVQQAALTGESMPTDKDAGDLLAAPAQLAEARNMVFLGTSVVSGTAQALVVATGLATAFGDIAVQLSAPPPETEFERGTRHFALLIMRTVLFLVLFVVLASLTLHRPPLESLLFAVALAVGLTPEFLPMIMGVTLAQGAVHMARQKVIVKHLSAIEDFGSMDVLCSDKTGTLTTGAMVLDRCLGPSGEEARHPLLLASLNSLYETGIRSPLDTAILASGHLETQDYTKVDEIPFDFERRRLSIIVESLRGRLLITKGAPESILHCSTAYEIEETHTPLDATARARCQAVYEQLSAEGYRVLGVASRPVPAQRSYTIADEQELVLAGFLAFVDPPMADVRDAVQALQRDGVTVKILTGDNELVTQHVCTQVGLDGHSILLGDEIAQMSDAALAAVAERTTVFARVSPAQKNRIILALKSRHHVVGFLGDGINDAPSLHTADVGISVANGVDVAKDAADILLSERTLAVLHSGIIEGRKAFANVMKYLLMGTSSNFGNMFSMAGAVLFLPFLPMLPLQILLNNFLYDLAQVTIPTDNVDPSFVRTPQRWDIRIIRNFMIGIGPISSLYDFLTFAILLWGFHASEALFHTGWFVESLATQTLVLFVIRTPGTPWHSRPSLPLAATTVLIVLIGLVLPFTSLAPVLGFVPLPGAYFLFLAGATLTYLVLVELVKRQLMGRMLA